MTWNYRIVKTEKDFGGKKLYLYNIHEVYYDYTGEPSGMTEDPVTFSSDLDPGEEDDESRVKDIIESLKLALKDIKKYPIFIPPKEWEDRGECNL